MAAATPIGNNLLPIIQGGRAVGYSATGQAATPSAETGTTNAVPAAGGNYTAYNANGSTTKYTNGVGTTTSVPSGTLNAVIANPGNQTAPASAVITSDTASQDLADKQGQISQLNQDTAQHQQTMQQAQAQPLSDKTVDQSASDQSSQTQQPASSSTGNPSLDDQIQSIIGGLGTQQTANDQSAQEQEQPIEDAQTQLEQQYNDMANNVQNQLDAIKSGVYPLSPTESSILNATQSNYQMMISAAQQSSNALASSIAGRLTAEGASMTSPTSAAWQVQATIDAGTKNVAYLNSQAALALSQVEEGFQKQDFDMVQTSWSDAADAFTQRSTELQNMLSNVTDAAKQQDAEISDNEKTALQAVMDSNTIDFQSKQNALAQSTLDEKTKMDLLNYNLKVSEDAGGLDGMGTQTSPVTVTAGGTPNAAQQATFLASFPPNIQTQIQGLADYSINPSIYPTRLTTGGSGLTQQQAITLAKKYDPSYDQNQYATRAATMKNFQSGAYSQNVNALNTAIGHLNDLVSTTGKLGNVGFTPANAVKNFMESTAGSGNVVGASTNIAAAVGELATAFKKTGATDAEISSLGTIDANSSPAQVKAFISTASSLLGSRLDALNETYQSSMGSAPTGGTFLSPTSQSVLLNLQNSGYDINIDNLDQTPVSQLQTFNSTSPENAATLQQLEQAMPDASPEEIVDYLQANGAM